MFTSTRCFNLTLLSTVLLYFWGILLPRLYTYRQSTTNKNTESDRMVTLGGECLIYIMKIYQNFRQTILSTTPV